MSIDDCVHEPTRLYVWKIDDDMPRSLYSTCAKCLSDYRVPNDEIVRRCTDPDDLSDPPFHVKFREACAAYLRNSS